MVLSDTVKRVDWSDESPDAIVRGTGRRSTLALLGLPCSRCRAYYEAQLTACPICGCSERVSSPQTVRIVRPKSRAA